MNISELDLNYAELDKLLNRFNTARYNDAERIQRLDLTKSLNKNSELLTDEHHHRVAVTLSDFEKYLKSVRETCRTIELPDAVREAFAAEIRVFPARELYTFTPFRGTDLSETEQNPISYETILESPLAIPMLLIGESGIGKTSLLKQIAFDRAQMCLKYDSDLVPVLVRLGQYSHAHSLMDLLYESFNSKGAVLSIDSFTSHLRQGRFIILLDAYDEAIESYIPDLIRDIKALADNYQTNKLIITTRWFRLPGLTPVKRYELSTLSGDKIEAFSRMYLGTDCARFLRVVADKGLVRLVSNTLILTLLILLYRKQSSLPDSRAHTLQTVVDLVWKWSQQKHGALSSFWPWDVVSSFLECLGFRSLIKGESYSLDSTSVEQSMVDNLNLLEKRRLVPPGLTLDQVLINLAATGFIFKGEEGVIFWHRAFMEYFAVGELARHCESQPTLLNTLATNPNYDDILPLVVFRSAVPDALIDRLLLYNIFTAARAVIECGMSEGISYRRTVDALIKRCYSPDHPIRKLALDLLRQIKGDYVDSQFNDLLASQYLRVQKTALVEIARRRLPNAREIVFTRKDWDKPAQRADFWDGPSGTSVIEALGEFEDAAAHQQIVDMWRDRQDVFTNTSCSQTLIRVAHRQLISENVRQALLGLFLSDDNHISMRDSEVADVLIALRDHDLVPALVSALKQTPERDRIIRAYSITKVLASYDCPEVVQQLIACVGDQHLGYSARAWFAKALSESKGVASFEVFQDLAHDDNDEVRSYGIAGLGKFPCASIREVVLSAVYPPPLEKTRYRDSAYDYTQTAAFRVLAQHRQIELLLTEEVKPEYLYDISLEVLLEAIATLCLHSMVPYLEGLVPRLHESKSIARCAGVLADLGHSECAQGIIDRLWREDQGDRWVAEHIMEVIHHLPALYAINLVDQVMAKRQETGDGSSYHLTSLCIEALAKIGTVEACDRLCEIAWSSADNPTGMDTELALRNLQYLAPRERAGWLVSLIVEHPGMEDSALRRALETLGVIGGDDCLPVLQEYLDDRYPEHTRATCFLAIQAIHKRAGRSWYNGQEFDAR